VRDAPVLLIQVILILFVARLRAPKPKHGVLHPLRDRGRRVTRHPIAGVDDLAGDDRAERLGDGALGVAEGQAAHGHQVDPADQLGAVEQRRDQQVRDAELLSARNSSAVKPLGMSVCRFTLIGCGLVSKRRESNTEVVRPMKNFS
jgi:hypothetical protein